MRKNMYSPEDYTHEELITKYKELQKRTSQSLSVEQQLINAKNSLDNEIALHKRMHEFNKRALIEMSEQDYADLVAEAVVDIFEIEFGMILIRNLNNGKTLNFSFEGIRLDTPKKAEMQLFAVRLADKIPNENVNKLDFNVLNKLFPPVSIHETFSVNFTDEENNLSVLVAGGIQVKNYKIYDALSTEKEIIFGIFSQQVMAQAVNKSKKRTIAKQIENINETSLRLEKITESFLTFGTSPRDNMMVLANLCGNLVSSDKAIYTELYPLTSEFENKGTACVKGIYKEFYNSLFPDADNFITIHPRLADTTLFRNHDCMEFKEYGTIISYPVIIDNKPEGVLNLLFKDELIPGETDKQIIKIISAGIAVEERRNKSVKALSESELRYRMLFEGTPHGILIYDTRTNMLKYANPSLCSMLGYSETEIIRLQMHDFCPDGISEGAAEPSIESYETVKSFLPSKAFFRKDGSRFFADVSSYVLNNGSSDLSASFITDITDRKTAAENLVENNKELQKINSELDNFVYSISHDLRAPLLAMKGLINLIKDDGDMLNDLGNYLSMMNDSIEKMDFTIVEILDYSRNARLDAIFEEIDLKEEVEKIFESLKYFHPEDIELRTDLDESVKFVSDKVRIGTLLKNLITNSVKYKRTGPDKSYVCVKSKFEEGNLRIQVRDNGEGIPKKDLGNVFRMFYRATNTVPGTGLGLYICKEIVSKLGGIISVDSDFGAFTEVNILIKNNSL